MYNKKTTTILRYFRRTDEPSMGFFPWGLLGLLLLLLPFLFGLTWFAKNTIESRVHAEVKDELALNDLDWVNVEVDGQEIKLSGLRPKIGDGDKAIAIAEKVRGDTWLGAFTAPTEVEGEFDDPKPVAKPVEKKAPVVAAKPVWGEMTSKLDSGILTLTGTVGSQAEKTELLSLAKENIAPPKVTKVVDQLTISSTSLIKDSQVLAKRSVSSIVMCDSGQARSLGGVYSINCQAQLDDASKIKTYASKPFVNGKLGQVIVSTANTCNQSFAKALDGKSIGFSIGSARLKSSSATLIDEIAAISKSCPGTVRVEGHTDDTGGLEANMKLSNARAESVVQALIQRGVKSERLKAQGFGPTQPRAQGISKEARTLNRRIEFKISE